MGCGSINSLVLKPLPCYFGLFDLPNAAWAPTGLWWCVWGSKRGFPSVGHQVSLGERRQSRAFRKKGLPEPDLLWQDPPTSASQLPQWFWAEAGSFRLLETKRLSRPCWLCGWVPPVVLPAHPSFPSAKGSFRLLEASLARYLFWQDLPCCGEPRVLPRLACLWWDCLTGESQALGAKRLPEPSCLYGVSCCAVWQPWSLPQETSSHPSPLLIWLSSPAVPSYSFLGRNGPTQAAFWC